MKANGLTVFIYVDSQIVQDHYKDGAVLSTRRYFDPEEQFDVVLDQEGHVIASYPGGTVLGILEEFSSVHPIAA